MAIYRSLLLITCLSFVACHTQAEVKNEQAESAHTFDLLQAKGTLIVDEAGEKVVLKGCNVGNWFLLEMWMLAIDHGQFADQYDFENNLADRFGEDEKDRLMEVYRENWITQRDFAIIKSFGFNTIRLPFNYRMMEDDDKPFKLKPDAFKWLDRAIDMAEAEGIYVILDMHAVQGGQSIDHPAGRVDQNKLWGDPVYGQRAAWLWKQIAQRYKDRKAVAGYDAINEPYGDFSMDVRPPLKRIFTEIYEAIRSTGDNHIIWASNPIWGGHGFYGNPHENGWTNVGFTEHHYPGLFGSNPAPGTHGNFIHRVFPEKQAELEKVQTPMFIGEWNPVFENLGGGDLMRTYFDEYGRRGWAATIWSYKILHDQGGSITDNWYMVSNAKPLAKPNFETASIEEIEAYFKWFGEMDYVIDEPMRHALTRTDPVSVDLPIPPPPMTEAPHHDELPGWTVTDINNAMPGGMQVHNDTEVTVYGGGNDIWNESDQFRLVWKEVTGDFTMTATLVNLRDSHGFAKAGLMARANLNDDSAHAMAHAFPGGKAAFGYRTTNGGTMEEDQGDTLGEPLYLKLTRKGNTLTGEYSADGQTWQTAGNPVIIQDLGKACHLGLAVLSHDAQALTSAHFKDIKITQD